MPVSFIPLFAALALALSAIFAVPFITIPAFAESDNAIRLGFLDSIDDPSHLHMSTAGSGAPENQDGAPAEIGHNSGAWQRGFGPVWVWNPPAEKPRLSVFASN
jgi:hypothetical protein